MSHDYLRPEWDRLSGVARIVYYDQRGCGQSGPADGYGWSDHVDDLRRLIARVSPDAPVVLAGSSWGSALATLYLSRYPEDVSAMVLSGLPTTGSLRRSSERFLTPLVLPSDGVPSRMLEAPRIRPLLGSRPDNAKAAGKRSRMMALLEPRFVADCPQVRAETNESMGTAPRVSVEGLGVPVLFFPDNVFTREFGVSVTLPEVSGSLTTIVGGGHDPWFLYPKEFFGVVETFLTELWSG
jgi:pimeloyl-ACP methyl ester carboxylesterase